MFSWPSNYDSCFTISSSITRDGVGLHSGDKTKVKISSFEEEDVKIKIPMLIVVPKL